MAIEQTQGVMQPLMINEDVTRNIRRRDGQDVAGPASVSEAKPSAAAAKIEADKAERNLKNATKLLNDFVKHFAIDLQFRIEEGQTIVKVMNEQTGEMIRQIPSEEALRMSKALDSLQGLIIQKKV